MDQRRSVYIATVRGGRGKGLVLGYFAIFVWIYVVFLPAAT